MGPWEYAEQPGDTGSGRHRRGASDPVTISIDFEDGNPDACEDCGSSVENPGDSLCPECNADYEMRMGYKRADVLQTEPTKLEPEFVFNDTDEDELESEDVTELTNTVPEAEPEILHFASEDGSYDSTDIQLLDRLRNLVDTGTETALGDMDQRNDAVESVVTELRDRGFDADNLVAMIKRADFPEWGPHVVNDPVEPYETSVTYVDKNEKDNLQNVTDLNESTDDIIKYTRARRRRAELATVPTQLTDATPNSLMTPSAVGVGNTMQDGEGSEDTQESTTVTSTRVSNKPIEFAASGETPNLSSYGRTDDNSDVVKMFQANFAASVLGNSSSGGTYSDDAIAENAQRQLDAMKRTAGRNYTLQEQAELIREAHPQGAGNLDDLDLDGTHYLV